MKDFLDQLFVALGILAALLVYTPILVLLLWLAGLIAI